MTRSIPYILVKNGNKAIDLYKSLFGAKLVSKQSFSPEIGKEMGFPKDFDYKNSTMHAILDIKGAIIYLADDVKDHAAEGRVEIVLDLDSKEQIDKIWGIVKKKKFKINMPLAKTFWGAWFGRFIDSEGIGWQLNFEEKKDK